MNTGPITRVATGIPMNGKRGPSHAWRILTSVPPDVALKDHSTSIPLVTPPIWRKRIDGAPSSTAISDSHHVGHARLPNGRPAAISTIPPPSVARARYRTYL